jgi:hypothetical protein
MMWRALLTTSSLLLSGSALLGCSDHDTDISTEEARSTGTLQMALTTELDGVRYGLQGDVNVTGPETVVLQAQPYEDFLELDLAPGAYTVALASGFQLFRLVPDGEPVPVLAELISPNSVDIQIESNATTEVEFRFAIPDEVDPPPPPGALRVGIAVERAAEEPVDPPPDPEVASFELDVWPIFQTNCGPCHTELGRGGHLVGSPTLEVADADARRLGATLIERLDGGGMPPACTGVPGDPNCIAVADLATIQLWLDTGLAP